MTWKLRAKCRGAVTDPDNDPFYPQKDTGGSTDAAKRICATCPVRDWCLAQAITDNERHGVWGGLSTRERDRLRRQGWTPDDRLPPVRLSETRGPASRWNRTQAQKAFTYARTHGTSQAAFRYGVSDDSLHRVWDRYQLGRPCRRPSRVGLPQNTRVPHSRTWAERTYQEAQRVGITRVARTRKVSRHTLHQAWAQYDLGALLEESA